MDAYLAMLLYTTASGSCIPAGGLLARIERVRPLWLEQELRHTIIAFGGGTLIAAVAFVLVPEGQEYFGSPILGVTLFLAGGVVFMLIERQLAAWEHHLPQTLAMLLDFVPESLAMGGMFALGSPAAPLLAILIGLQNLPEGFNAYREILSASRHHARRTMLTMFLLILAGPIAGMLGWHVAARFPDVVGATMLFASGGILYLLFQDIAPKSQLERHWAPTLGAVVGFCLAMVADYLLSSH
jgi:ZIP family zinc transporter